MVPESGKMLTICGIRKDAGGGKLSSWNRINISGFPRSSPLDPALPPRVPPASLKLGWGGGGEAGVKVGFFSLPSFISSLRGRGRERLEVFYEPHFVSQPSQRQLAQILLRTPSPHRPSSGPGAPGQSTASWSSAPAPRESPPEKEGEPPRSHLLGWSLVLWWSLKSKPTTIAVIITHLYSVLCSFVCMCYDWEM